MVYIWPATESVALSGQISNAGREKCEVTFSFHVEYFPVTYSTFAVLYSSAMNGAGYETLVRVCHYGVNLGRLALLL